MTTPGLDEPILRYQELFQRPGPIPDFRLESVFHVRDMPLVARSPDSTTSSSGTAVTCGPKDTTGFCERSVGAGQNTTIPIVLGVALPLSFAFILLVVLHRRHVKKLRQEDAEDKHKSLDFGMDGAVVTEKKRKGRKSKRGPEVATMEEHHSDRRDRQLSMDLGMTNPYLLPPELQQSRESLHSLSRSINTGDDKYRATNFIPDDGSLRSPSSLRGRDDSSIYTYSSRVRTETESTKGLLPNGHSHLNEVVVPIIQKPEPTARGDKPALLMPMAQDGVRESYVSTNSDAGNIAAMRASNNYLGQYISGGAKNRSTEGNPEHKSIADGRGSAQGEVQVQVQELPATAVHNAHEKQDSIVPDSAGFDFNIPANTYELSSGPEPISSQTNNTANNTSIPQIHEAPGHEVVHREQPNPAVSQTAVAQVTDDVQHVSTLPGEAPDINIISAYEDEVNNGSDYYDEEVDDIYDINEYRDALGYDPRLLTMGTRPLPPDDPSENPEERAIRIRSFYKEYFEETTKPGGDKARLSYFDGSENYIDDYYGSNNHISYGEPPNNAHHLAYTPDHGRARGPGYGSMQGPAYNSGYRHGPRAPSTMSARAMPGRHRATVSNGSYMSGGPGPRAYSSASQRMPGSRTKFQSKPRPPPQPLSMLPSPFMMKDDSMLPNAIDYAPPQVFKRQRAGTPDSLRGGVKPYTPTGKAYNPLVSSFDDLSVLPSPHHLRRSGTFSSLDFAPPRYAAPTGGSDSGSIRSNRSGMSAKQLHHIRKGAYRLSRVPKEVAGTREELAHALKPQWNAR